MQPTRVTANGVEFAYLEDGPADGPLALCLHGFPDHAPSFQALMGELADAGFRAVAPWMRGYSPSGLAPDGNYEAAALAADAVALADALAPEGDAVLIGHDWGALAAYGAAAWRPDRFRRVVVMAVPPPAVMGGAFLTRPDQIKRSWYMFFFLNPLADLAIPAGDYEFIEMLWRDWSPGYAPPPGSLDGVKRALAAPGGLAAAIGYYRATFDPSERPDPALDEVRAAAARPIGPPALYLHGADDGCISADLADPTTLAPLFASGVRVEIVDGAGHFLHLERPNEVNRLILDFLGGA